MKNYHAQSDSAASCPRLPFCEESGHAETNGDADEDKLREVEFEFVATGEEGSFQEVEYRHHDLVSGPRKVT